MIAPERWLFISRDRTKTIITSPALAQSLTTHENTNRRGRLAATSRIEHIGGRQNRDASVAHWTVLWEVKPRARCLGDGFHEPELFGCLMGQTVEEGDCAIAGGPFDDVDICLTLKRKCLSLACEFVVTTSKWRSAELRRTLTADPLVVSNVSATLGIGTSFSYQPEMVQWCSSCIW